MRTVLLALAITIPTSGCQGGTDTNLEDAFCQILALPTADVVVAGATTADAPDATAEDRRVEIDLIESEDGMFSGVVAYTADEAGHFAFGFDENVPVRVTNATGSGLAWVVEVDGAACDDLAVRRTVELSMDTVYLEIGPASVGTVSMVAEESNDDL